MNVVVPMAGRGMRFGARGYSTPKPLIEVADKPMVEWALRSLDGVNFKRLVFVALKEHEREYGVTKAVLAAAKRCFRGRDERARLLRPTFPSLSSHDAERTGQLEQRTQEQSSRLETPLGADPSLPMDHSPELAVVLLDDVTEGQLCTVLAARDAFDLDDDVLVISSDTYVVSQLGADIGGRRPDCAGIISVANLPGDAWSFAKVDETADGEHRGRVVDVAEKSRISDHASTGLYYFANGREFVSTSDEMIRNRELTRGEFYVIPVYRKLIDRGRRVDISRAFQMLDMGNPESLAESERELARTVQNENCIGAEAPQVEKCSL